MIAFFLAAWVYLAAHAAIGQATATPCTADCVVQK